MMGLKVKNWQDWEKLCCYFLQDIVHKRFDVQIQYQSYGSRGQSQFGIDLIPSTPLPSVAVVGQCKLTETSFTWKMVLDELKKTDSYQNSIEHYFLLTTANPHTTVQDVQHRGSYFHQRNDGTKFQVHVRYWDNNQNLNFVPSEVLKDIFPEVWRTFERSASTGTYHLDLVDAIPKFKSYIQRVITLDDLFWLENWDFSKAYVLEKNFATFFDLFIEHDRTVTALKGIPDWLLVGDRSELAKGLPAGKRFYNALGYFRSAIGSHITGDSLPTGERTLSLKGLPNSFVTKTTNEWKSTAEHLAKVYREDVLGEERC
jgi:hypothetical protein